VSSYSGAGRTFGTLLRGFVESEIPAQGADANYGLSCPRGGGLPTVGGPPRPVQAATAGRILLQRYEQAVRTDDICCGQRALRLRPRRRYQRSVHIRNMHRGQWEPGPAWPVRRARRRPKRLRGSRGRRLHPERGLPSRRALHRRGRCGLHVSVHLGRDLPLTIERSSFHDPMPCRTDRCSQTGVSQDREPRRLDARATDGSRRCAL